MGRASFDVRLESGAILHHEWRDDSQPYQVGPSLWIQNGKLTVAGKPLMDIPNNTWVHIEIAAGLGSGKSTWDLKVAVGGQEDRTFTGLANGSPDWKKLDWLGFCSMAGEKTAFYLDNIEVANLSAK
jgi:hypothetical protein